ncbi:HAD-IA family hydrolase [Treponema sp.]|uniref:HAD family hydrolase n=1 Tax=Treponema sp. TaxID=166 RepID=UPI00298E8BFB|nr:HAD-IA family hydrolase [Treponema sp.]MCQ2240181.1 HAD-IA family hydrolase [Treponema sp.]
MNKGYTDGIILDIDGTIWNTTGIVAVAWNKAIEKSGLDAKKVNAQMLQQEFGKTMDVIAQDLWPNLSKADQDKLMSYCCTEEQIEIKNNTIDITYPGVIETIKELSTMQNLYIVSNCQDGYIELTMEKTGITPYIKDFECFGRTGKAKAENIQILCSRNNITSPLYVGDTQGDCDSCKQAEIPFIWASYGFGRADKYYEKIDSFEELIKIVTSINK